MNPYVPGPLSESAYHLLTVIDFLCLAGGTYLLLILHDRTRRSGHLLIAAGLAVLTLQIIPEHLAAAAPDMRYAGATLSLGVACLLIVCGTLALVEGRERYHPKPIHRVLLVVAATLAVLGTFFVWALPFWEPLRSIITDAGTGTAFVTFQHGLRVGVGAAFLACAWITWERRMLGNSVSRMFGAAYVCWAIFLILGISGIFSPEGFVWIAKSVKVLGSLFVGNALVLYVYRAERRAAQRQRRLALIDRVTRAAIEAPRLQAMIESATEEVHDLLGARMVATYLDPGDSGEGKQDLLRLAHTLGGEPDLPKEFARTDDHPIVRAFRQWAIEEFGIDSGTNDSDDLRAVAVPLMGLSKAIGVMVLGMGGDEQLERDDIEALHKAGAQLGVIMQHLSLLEETSTARDRWRQTFDSITELLTIHDTEGRIMGLNRAALTFSGLTEAGVIGRTLCDVFGADCEEQEDMLETCVSTGASPGVGMHRSGGRVYQVQVTPLRGDDRAITGCVRVARDVTSRYRAEERLAQSERRYRELAEGANDIIYTHDMDGNFLYVNPAAVRVLGYSQERLSRLKFWDIVAAESMAKARTYVKNLRDGKPQEEQIELRMRCADDRVAVVQLRANMLRRGGNLEAVHGIARDMTAEKQLTTQLMQADRLASVGTLIAGVAHELNNPLTTISGYAEMLASKEHDGNGGIAVETITEEAERCRRVAQNLLNFAHQSDSRRMEFDLNALTRGVIDLRAYDLRAANIEVHVDLQEDLPTVIGDYGQIQQLVYNLVDNAYHALGGEEAGVLEIATWAEDDCVHLRVADSGPGIPEKLKGRIFEPFVTTKPRGEGTGLGLSICRRIIEVHGGAITGHNRPGGGASFDAVLPVSGAARAADLEDERFDASPEDEEAEVPDGSLDVLFIDDEPSLCALVNEYLTRKGHDVTVAQSGEDGLEKAVAGDFDVIICDMRLPGISGEDVCMGLLERKPEAAHRVMVATGDVLSPQTQSFFDRTGLPHIHKPFKLNELETAIARISEGRPVREL